ncbi:hypothetical protein [Geitlerinema calcuttense]|uniref:Uncharacterized protein n=1 Tax=Geitlerinema calcuttense NRMC-F 0142 TaxID=2922238 RepID=A0ABT7M070_9CYAN|nr:hypothetical protein [Geitlerinema calcuttense]MDL5057030.1 hypothetical protein [Geitlerinema calcuttense NRMC-F 0142]
MSSETIVIHPAFNTRLAQFLIVAYILVFLGAILTVRLTNSPQLYFILWALLIYSPFLLILDSLGQSLEISESHLIRYSPFRGKAIIRWDNIQSINLIRGRHQHREVRIFWPKRRIGLHSTYSFTPKKPFSRQALLRLIELAEKNQVPLKTGWFGTVEEWKYWARGNAYF